MKVASSIITILVAVSSRESAVALGGHNIFDRPPTPGLKFDPVQNIQNVSLDSLSPKVASLVFERQTELDVVVPRIADSSDCSTGYDSTLRCPNFCGPGSIWKTTPEMFSMNWLCSDPCLGADEENDLWPCLNSGLEREDDPEIVCNQLCETGIFAGGGLQNCIKNDNNAWQCRYRESPLTEIPTEESTLLVVCDDLPEWEPTPSDCECFVLLSSFANWDGNSDKLCKGCQIAASAIDGEWGNTW